MVLKTGAICSFELLAGRRNLERIKIKWKRGSKFVFGHRIDLIKANKESESELQTRIVTICDFENGVPTDDFKIAKKEKSLKT
jgi:hypothetical protein